MSSSRTASGPAVSDPVCLLIACIALVIVVAILAVVSFPLGFLDGSAAFWRYPILDYAQHVIGGRYFIADAWRWPLLIVPDLGTPPGTNIGMTDSIPIAALGLKLLRGWYGYARPYLPMWILLCYLLQGPACAIALYVLGVRHVAALVLGGLIAVFTPILLFRFGHAALCAQFLLLLGLALHLHLARATSRRVTLVFYLPLLLVALLVHIYLLAMLFAIMLASLLQALWTERLTIPAVLGQLAIIAPMIGAVMWACGYLDLGPIPMKPYGEWPLDLAAPFFPAPSGIFGIGELPRDRPGEDFAWFGTGMFVLLIAALAGSWRQLGSLARAHLPSLMICGLLIIFAVTYVVRIGPVLVLGMGAERVRQAVLGGLAHGGTLRTLVGSLDTMDYVRIVAYGVVLSALAALVVIRAWQWRKLRFLRFIGLVLLVGAVVLAARPSAIPLILSNFQASARFVWPVIYLISVLAIAGVWRAYSPPIALSLLVVALVLQVFDTMPFWRAMRYYAVYEPQSLPEEAVLLADMAKANRVTFVPTYLCAFAEPLDRDARDVAIGHLTDLEVLVSRFVRPTNSVRNSRMTATDIEGLRERCDRERAEAVAQLDTPGTLTIVLNDTPMEAQLRADLLQRSGCTRLSSGMVCVAR